MKQLKGREQEVMFVILNAEAINYIDSSAVFMLRQLINDLKNRGIKFLVSGAIGPIRDIFYTSGLIDDIGKDNLFVKTNEAFEHCQTLSAKTAIEEKITLQSKKILV